MKQKEKNLISEVRNLLKQFFQSYKVEDKILDIPKSVKQLGIKVASIHLGITLVSLVFAFMLKISNYMIESKLIILGVLVFMIYRGKDVIREAMWLLESSESKKFELIFEDEIVLRGSKIIGKTAGRVLKYDSNNSLYRIMSNESMLNCIKNYLTNLWQYKIRHGFDVFQICSVIVMIVVAVITNTTISQLIFIPMILFFIVVSFFCSAYISLSREKYYKKHREYNNIQSVVANDLLRVPVIVSQDLDMRLGKFQKSLDESKKNIKDFHMKVNLSRFLVSILEAFSQYGIIILYLMQIKWETIDLSTITEIAAILVIVETALWNVGRIADTLNDHSERITILEKEEFDMELILDVYHKETDKNKKTKEVSDINLGPFSIKYLEESENDKPFTLESKQRIFIRKGEIVVLYGPSGSGKSTFMKMLTERIKLEKSGEIPTTSRYMFFDEKLSFGSLSIYEEIFCESENPDLDKMQSILKNLHLWEEIKSNCIDIWKWMKEKRFEQLSNGQKQRLILAKMLYWLDDCIDVLVLDECTSGLDDKAESDFADAEKILEYIVRYANSDKKRTVFIATHQNIDGFKKNLENEYIFRKFYFQKSGDRNLIREI